MKANETQEIDYKSEHQKVIQKQLQWIRSGKIGCVFASALAKNPDAIGWHFTVSPENLIISKKTLILSVIFPDKNIEFVKDWALKNGMYIENLSDMYEGLRIKIDDNISWVQYFGSDSHVKTRQSPYPMLSFAVKLPTKYYSKVGFNGILHLAHASIEFMKEKVADRLWEQSFIKTKKELGHSPTIKEASKTTFTK